VTLLDMVSINTVFRELLQNADDAEAHSVEIRFETGAYVSREKGGDLQSDNTERGDFPDLKTAMACSFHNIHLVTDLIEIYDYSHRSTNGRSRITAYYLGTRIGADSKILVHRHSHFSFVAFLYCIS
jgi:hypothetical protein